MYDIHGNKTIFHREATDLRILSSDLLQSSLVKFVPGLLLVGWGYETNSGQGVVHRSNVC